MQIKSAQKFRQYARVCFWGVPKAGKSHGALATATAMVGPNGKVGVISSEYGSTNLLSHKFPHDIIDLTTDDHGNPIANPFAPARYEEALKLLVDNGYEAIVIDSLSHAWEGEGGVLERVNETQNRFQDGWGKVGTPLYQHLMKTILSTKAHIFITIRAKDGYVLEPGKDGKMVPRNVGLKPVIRSSFGYEMQLTIRMDALVGHIDESAFQDEFPQGTQIVRPGEDVAYTLLQCLDGVPTVEPTVESTQMRLLLDDLYALAPHVYVKYAQWEEMALRAAFDIKEGPLPTDYNDEHIRLMQAYVESKKKPARKAQREVETPDSPVNSNQSTLNNGTNTTTPTEQTPPSQNTVSAQSDESPTPTATSPDSSAAPELTLSEQIRQAKLRASSLGLAQDAAEWAGLLKTCKVTAIESVADLQKVTAHMDAFERDQAASVQPKDSKPEVTVPTQSSKLDTSVRDKLNDLYVRAKKLGLCANDRQFVGYVRRVVKNPSLDIKYVTLDTLAKVEDDIVTQEMAKEIDQVGSQAEAVSA